MSPAMSSSDLNDSFYDDFGAIGEPIPFHAQINFTITQFYLAVALVGLLGNVGLLTAIVCDRRLHNNTNILLVNGCIADILVSLFVALVQYYERMVNSWKIGIVLCKLREFIAEFSPQTSIIIMVFISAERFVAITRPLSAASVLSKRKLMSAALLAWMVPGIISSRVLFTATTHDIYGIIQCYSKELMNERAVYVVESLLFYLLPLVVMTVLYWVVIGNLRQSIQQQQVMIAGTSGSQNAAGQAKNQYKREKRRESQGDRNGQSIQNQGQQPEPGHKVQNRVQGHRHHGGIQSQVSSSARSTCSQGSQHLSVPSRRCVMSHKGGGVSSVVSGGLQSNQHSIHMQNTNTSAKSRMNVVTMLTTSVCLFALFTFPIHLARIYTSITQDLHLFGSETLGFVIVANSLAFRCLDSALNPAVILILSPRIRGSLQRLVCRCRSENTGREAGAGVVIRGLNQGHQNGGTQLLTTTRFGGGTAGNHTLMANSCSVVSFAPGGNSVYNRTSAM